MPAGAGRRDRVVRADDCGRGSWSRRTFLLRLAVGAASGTAASGWLVGGATVRTKADNLDPFDSHAAGWQWDNRHSVNWPGFRGPCGLAVCEGRRPPLVWDGASGRNVRWKVRLPLPGTSSPAVWQDRVFLTGATAERREVWCFAAADGRLLWRGSVQNVPGSPSEPPDILPDVTHAPASPACDGRRVVAVFANADLACFSLTGRLLWARNLGPLHVDYAYASSPLLAAGRVFVQVDGRDGGRVLALDAATGKPLWEQRRRLKSCWSSPVLVRVKGQWQLVLNGNPDVVAYEPVTGRQLWRVQCMEGDLTPSPAFSDGVVAVAQDYARCAAIDASTGRLLWQREELDLPDVASPVATRGLLFLPTSFGTVTCLRLSDGRKLWSHEFDEGGYGSPVVVDDRVYWTNFAGHTYVFRAAETFQLLASLPLGEKSNCTPAFVGRSVYVRGEKHLFAFGEPATGR